jgi:Arc/MetJ family transcription regulator
MAKTVIDINEDVLALAAKVLGTRTKKDTVNAALQEIVAREQRLAALEELRRLAADGAYDDLLKPEFEQEAWR